MKSSSNSSSFLVLLILVVAIGIPAALAGSTPEPVLDGDGKALRTGVNYYIVPLLQGRYGGVTLRPTRNNTCPLDVVQSSRPFSNGTPFTFTPVDPKKGVIRVSTDLNIEFTGVTLCIQSMVWKVADFDELTGKWFVTTRGVKGNPGPETLRNWFKIEKHETQYKLRFCPTVCDICRPICMDVGVYYEDGVLRLALTSDTDNPLWVMFKKEETGSVQNH